MQERFTNIWVLYFNFVLQFLCFCSREVTFIIFNFQTCIHIRHISNIKISNKRLSNKSNLNYKSENIFFISLVLHYIAYKSFHVKFEPPLSRYRSSIGSYSPVLVKRSWTIISTLSDKQFNECSLELHLFAYIRQISYRSIHLLFYYSLICPSFITPLNLRDVQFIDYVFVIVQCFRKISLKSDILAYSFNKLIDVSSSLLYPKGCS